MSRPKILVVDDSSVLRLQIGRMLSQAGYDVVLAADGFEAIRQLRLHRPHLVVLDIQMPDLDGYGVCEEIKQMGEPWNRLPIIFLTSLESNALSLLGTEMGAYLKKPVRAAALLDKVAEFVKTPLAGARQVDPEEELLVDSHASGRELGT